MRQLVGRISHALFGLRFRLLLLVLLACAPLVALTLHTASSERRRAVTAWSERAQRLTRRAQREEADFLGQTRQLLLAVSESSAVQYGNGQTRKKSLGEVLARYPTYANLSVADTNGEVLASAVPLGEPGNQADREFFRRVLTTRAFAIGATSTVFTNGKPSVTFGCPVFDGSDHVQAVVFATLEPDWLAGARSELPAQVPKGATWTELDRNGAILVRYPASALSLGQPFPDRALARTVLSQPDGIVEAPDSSGSSAFCAFAWRDSQLVPGGVATLLSMPKRILFARANRALLRSLMWLGTAMSLALALGWAGSSFLVVRPVEALVRASARLATGDLTTRTGLRHGKDELGQLTRTFDQMAQALEQRELERQLAEETLQTRDNMIRELPLLPAAVCVCDQSGVVELYNRTAVELWGWEPPDHDGSRRFCGSYLLFRPDGTPMPCTESPAAEVLRTGVPVRNRELVIGRPDGSRVPVLANVVPLRDPEGAMIGAVSCFQDITERKQAEEKLQQSNDNLQLLSHRLVESQETERRHIARELHDEVGQTLTVAEMNLQALVQSPGAAPLKGRLKESLQAVERVLEQVRDLSLNLRPSMLDDLGLEPALRWYTKRQAALAGLQAEFRAEALEDRLDPIVETACFRVAQEALTNVVRHARARLVAVELRKQDGRLELFVRDDGVGFDVAALREKAVLGASLGLLSMEERATLADGGLECKSTPGQGTEIRAWFPLKWRTPNS
ncbi:MAG: PAS domain-containing protein [Limisphaerales bacterium]